MSPNFIVSGHFELYQNELFLKLKFPFQTLKCSLRRLKYLLLVCFINAKTSWAQKRIKGYISNILRLFLGTQGTWNRPYSCHLRSVGWPTGYNIRVIYVAGLAGLSTGTICMSFSFAPRLFIVSISNRWNPKK